jgi:hypothetical protein
MTGDLGPAIFGKMAGLDGFRNCFRPIARRSAQKTLQKRLSEN